MCKPIDFENKVFKTTSFDEKGNASIELTDLSPALVLDYLYAVKSPLAETFSTIPFIEVLRKMDLTTESNGKLLIKNVAAMMFCKNPAKYFPVTQVDIVLFPEGCIQNPNNLIEIPKIVGTIPEMIKQALDFIQVNVIQKYIIKPKDRAESIVYYNYPFQAIKEAVVNALLHRDYQEREPVEITIEPDKISILNYSGPESLHNTLTVHAIEQCNTQTMLNPRLADFLQKLGIVERKSSGITTIQKELCNNGSDTARIETDEDRTYFMIEIPCREVFQ